jgi:glycosyltransferase involved in cell wall biosynthesis
MKASIIFSTHNKNWCLPNTLKAISRQITSFPLEVCIVDDCSTVDPAPIIKEFLPNAKYLRLEKHHNFLYAPNLCLDMVSDDTKIILPMSSDIIMLKENSVELLCQGVSKKRVVFAEVSNIPVPDDAYLNFDEYAAPLINDWNSILQHSLKPLHVSRHLPTAWLFFLGAILKEDLLDIGYRDNSCDAVLWQKMAQQNFDGELLTTVPVLHQNHPRFDVSCPVANTCNFYCSRTSENGRWKKQAPTIKPFDIIS